MSDILDPSGVFEDNNTYVPTGGSFTYDVLPGIDTTETNINWAEDASATIPFAYQGMMLDPTVGLNIMGGVLELQDGQMSAQSPYVDADVFAGFAPALASDDPKEPAETPKTQTTIIDKSFLPNPNFEPTNPNLPANVLGESAKSISQATAILDSIRESQRLLGPSEIKLLQQIIDVDPSSIKDVARCGFFKQYQEAARKLLEKRKVASEKRNDAIPPKADADLIKANIANLGDSSFKVRESASTALATISRKYPNFVRGLLEEAVKSSDTEVHERATKLLSKMNGEGLN